MKRERRENVRVGNGITRRLGEFELCPIDWNLNDMIGQWT